MSRTIEIGPELDIIIAEKVLGLEVRREYDDIGRFSHAYTRRDSSDSWTPVAPYSIDDSLALNVFKKLRESGKWCCLKIFSDYGYIYEVSLTREDLTNMIAAKDLGKVEVKHDPDIIIGNESLAAAICLAAYETIDFDNK